jgi:VanZ family protein
MNLGMRETWRQWGKVTGWTAFVLWAVTLWILSSMPPKSLGSFSFPHIDKVIHFIYFGSGGFLLAWAMACTVSWPARLRSSLVLFVIMGIGFLDEWRQTFTPGRQGADVFDFLADAAGGFAGVLLAFALYEWIKKYFSSGTGRLAPTGD